MLIKVRTLTGKEIELDIEPDYRVCFPWSSSFCLICSLSMSRWLYSELLPFHELLVDMRIVESSGERMLERMGNELEVED